MILQNNSIPGIITSTLFLEYFTEFFFLEKVTDTNQKQYRVSEKSNLRINLKAEVWAVSFYSVRPGTLTKEQ